MEQSSSFENYSTLSSFSKYFKDKIGNPRPSLPLFNEYLRRPDATLQKNPNYSGVDKREKFIGSSECTAISSVSSPALGSEASDISSRIFAPVPAPAPAPVHSKDEKFMDTQNKSLSKPYEEKADTKISKTFGRYLSSDACYKLLYSFSKDYDSNYQNYRSKIQGSDQYANDDDVILENLLNFTGNLKSIKRKYQKLIQSRKKGIESGNVVKTITLEEFAAIQDKTGNSNNLKRNLNDSSSSEKNVDQVTNNDRPLYNNGSDHYANDKDVILAKQKSSFDNNFKEKIPEVVQNATNITQEKAKDLKKMKLFAAFMKVKEFDSPSDAPDGLNCMICNVHSFENSLDYVKHLRSEEHQSVRDFIGREVDEQSFKVYKQAPAGREAPSTRGILGMSEYLDEITDGATTKTTPEVSSASSIPFVSTVVKCVSVGTTDENQKKQAKEKLQLSGNDKSVETKYKALRQLLNLEIKFGLAPKEIKLEDWYIERRLTGNLVVTRRKIKRLMEDYDPEGLQEQKLAKAEHATGAPIGQFGQGPKWSKKTLGEKLKDIVFPTEFLYCFMCNLRDFKHIHQYGKHLIHNDHKSMRDLNFKKTEAVMHAFEVSAELAEEQRKRKLANAEARIKATNKKLENNPSEDNGNMRRKLQDQIIQRDSLRLKSPELLAYEKNLDRKKCEMCKFSCEHTFELDDHLCSLQHLKSKYDLSNTSGMTPSAGDKTGNKLRSTYAYTKEMIRLMEQAKNEVEESPLSLESIPIYNKDQMTGLSEFELEPYFFCRTCTDSMTCDNVEQHAKSLQHYKNLLADLSAKNQEELAAVKRAERLENEAAKKLREAEAMEEDANMDDEQSGDGGDQEGIPDLEAIGLDIIKDDALGDDGMEAHRYSRLD